MGKIILPDRGKFGFVGSADDVSDGSHTIGELYRYRMLYNALLFNEWAAQQKFKVHKSRLHSDGEKPFGGGWFVVMAELPTGQISNHYKDEYWDLFEVQETPVAHAWDGHTSDDVADRLEWQIKTKQIYIIGTNPRDVLTGRTWRRMAMIEQYGTRAEIKTARAVMRDAGDMETMHVDDIPAAVQQIHEIFFAIRDRSKRDLLALGGKVDE